jgi:hypothetical protein
MSPSSSSSPSMSAEHLMANHHLQQASADTTGGAGGGDEDGDEDGSGCGQGGYGGGGGSVPYVVQVAAISMASLERMSADHPRIAVKLMKVLLRQSSLELSQR